MKKSPEHFDDQSNLPVVGDAAIQAMMGDVNDTSFDDCMLGTYERMAVQRPDLAAVLARYSMGMSDDESEKLARSYAAGVTFRLFELQAESDDMNRSFNVGMAPGLNGRSILPVVSQETIDGLLDVNHAQGQSFGDLVTGAFDRMAASQPVLLGFILRLAKGHATAEQEAAVLQTAVITYMLLERQDKIDQMSDIVGIEE